MVRLISLAAVGLLAFTPSTTRTSGDGATRQYLVATYRLNRVIESNLAASKRGLSHLERSVRHECAGIAAMSTVGPAASAINTEALGTVENAFLLPDRKVITSYTRAVELLRWPSTKLTSLAHAHARTLALLLGWRPPPLCSILHVWAATGFRTVPSPAVRYAAFVKSLEEAQSTVPPKLLEQYLQPNATGLLAKVEGLEIASNTHTERSAYARFSTL